MRPLTPAKVVTNSNSQAVAGHTHAHQGVRAAAIASSSIYRQANMIAATLVFRVPALGQDQEKPFRGRSTGGVGNPKPRQEPTSLPRMPRHDSQMTQDGHGPFCGG